MPTTAFIIKKPKSEIQGIQGKEKREVVKKGKIR